MRRLDNIMKSIKLRSYIGKTAIIVGLAASAVFNAGATGPAANIGASSGDDQTALVGTTLPVPYVVLVTDSNGNAVSGSPVTWTITGLNGSLSTADRKSVV